MLVLAAMVGAVAFASSAHAEGGLQVWPTRVDITAERGGDASALVTVRNGGEETMSVSAYVMDFDVDGDGNYVFSAPGDDSFSASRWLSINSTVLELEPGASRQVEAVVAPPSFVEPGGHYAALFFETAASSTDQGVSVSARIPALFYITVPGVSDADVVADAEIRSLLLPRAVAGGPVDVGVTVRNGGNVHLDVAAKAYFIDLLGRRSTLDLGQILVLPGSEAEFRGTWRGTPFLGRVGTAVVIGYFDEVGGLVNRVERGEFWVIPWVPLTAGGVLLLSVAALVVALRKRYRLRLERRTGPEAPS